MNNETIGPGRKKKSMSPRELLQHVQRLSPRGQVAESLQRAMQSRNPREVWYDTQKQHLTGWLKEYDGPGYYGRSRWTRSAEFVYNHFHCAPGLLWLAEAAGAPRFALVKGKAAVLEAGRNVGPNSAAGAAALRRVLPWAMVEALLRAR